MVRIFHLFAVLLVVATAWGIVPIVHAEPPPGEDIWLETLVDRPDGDRLPYEGEMIRITVKGYYHDLRIGKGHLDNPAMASFDWMQLGRDEWSDAMVEGRKYTVVTRKLAVFPRASGTLTLEPFVHNLTLIGPDGQWTKHRFASPPVTLEVQAPPEDPSRTWWLPARAVTFTDSWSQDPATIKANETATRRVTITALGANPQTLPPAPAMRERWLITFVEPEERAVRLTEDGPETTVTWVWSLRPITGEPGVLPEVRIPWFDTTTEVPKEIVLAAAPIGEGEFGANTAAHWANGLQGGLFVAASALVGIALGLGLVLSGGNRRFKRPAPLAWGRWRIREWSARRTLHDAREDGDPTRLHRAARSYLKDAGSGPARDIARDSLRRAEQALYSNKRPS